MEQGIWCTKPIIEPLRLGFCLGCANNKGGCGGGPSGGADIVVVMVGACNSMGTGLTLLILEY